MSRRLESALQSTRSWLWVPWSRNLSSPLASHTGTALSQPPAAMYRPSGLHATERSPAFPDEEPLDLPGIDVDHSDVVSAPVASDRDELVHRSWG